jgi:tetratricopeptide (TPR) repeat protein
MRRPSAITLVLLPVALALIGNVATNTVQVAGLWAVASWIAVGLLVIASIAVETRRARSADLHVARVRKLDNPLEMGVHKAAPGGSRVPPFVPRDRTPELEKALLAGGFVLVVGDSTAGKTRLAYEAMRTCLPRHVCIRPRTPDALSAALALARRRRHSIVWLDDLERYVTAADWNGVAVLATIRANERDELASSPDRQRVRTGRDVLSAITAEIRLDRMWSDDELARARATADERIALGVAAAPRHGVAETIAAGPQLLQKWQDAQDRRGAAIVAAAVDARLAGYYRPLSEDVLRTLHTTYLPAAERLGSWEDALAWATRPVAATSSMLEPVRGGYLAFDYLVDAVHHTNFVVPVPTWEVLVAVAEPSDLGELGLKASFHGQFELVERVARTLLDAGHHLEAAVVAAALGNAGRSDRALELLEDVLERAENDPVLRLDVLSILVWESGEKYGDMGDPEAALPLARRLVEESTALHGPTHSRTLFARMAVARQLGGAGEIDAALKLASDVVTVAESVRPPDEQLILSARFERCVWTRVVHGDAAGVEAFAELLRQLRDLADPDPRLETMCMWNLGGALIDSGDAASAQPVLAEALELSRQLSGDDHQETLMIRKTHLNALAAVGDPSAAERERQLIADCVQVLGAEHPFTRQLVGDTSGDQAMR